jgi:hypothetical protein
MEIASGTAVEFHGRLPDAILFEGLLFDTGMA